MALKIKMRLEPREQFMPFMERKQRFGCVVAHRRSGKIFHAIMDMVARALAYKRPGPPHQVRLDWAYP